jgi:hypothetical protein
MLPTQTKVASLGRANRSTATFTSFPVSSTSGLLRGRPAATLLPGAMNVQAVLDFLRSMATARPIIVSVINPAVIHSITRMCGKL